tara:strand:- start:169 stop:618 length:450 start_codon:yes stop_codon:yes gene_type:complete
MLKNLLRKYNFMNSFNLTYAAYLFPAIPLMMISFGNRYTSLSKLIRKIHDEFINKEIRKSDKSATRYLAQLEILSLRLKYVQAIQTISGLAFLLNLITILFGLFSEDKIVVILFILALSFFSLAIILFIIEIQLSSRALKTHLEDLEEI